VRAPVHAAIYPNFGSISPIIIIEDKRREPPPVLNLDAMEGSDRLERGDRETTITTPVAGTELTTRTGHQYNQIPEPHVETTVKELEETSREHGSVGQPVITNMTAEPEKDQLRTDLRESRADDDVIPRRLKVRERAENNKPDDVPDQPSSPRPTDDQVAPSGADTDRDNGPTTLEKVKVRTSPETEELDESEEENIPTLPSATIDCGPDNNVQDQSSPRHQRPTRHVNRPTRFHDAAFDTQFEPKPRRKQCQRIRRHRDAEQYTNDRERYFQRSRGAHRQLSQNNGKTTIDATTQETTPVHFQIRHSSRKPVKTLKSLTTAPLLLSSTTAESTTVNKVITAARPTTAAAAARHSATTALPAKSKVKSTPKFPVTFRPASVAGKIQIASIDRSRKSVYFKTDENSVLPTSIKSVEKAVTTRTDDNTEIMKISETTDRVRHRRRKQRKKKQRPNPVD